MTSRNTLNLSEASKGNLVALANVNYLVGFPIDEKEIIQWALDVERLAPDTTPDKLSFLMDCFKMDLLQWDRSRGIQNVFNGLKMIAWNEDSGIWEIKKQWPG